MSRVLVLDVDGTLVDTNYHHALAWFRAFRRFDVTVPVWRIHRAIGMGGDQLVPTVAGQDVEDRLGDSVRDVWKKEVDAILDEVCPIEGARRLLEAARDAGYTVVLASSGKPDHVDKYLDLLDARELANDWTSSGDVSETKPEPNLIEVALRKAGDDEAVVVGDSVWDCQAAERIGLPSVAVRTGGFGERELRDNGASRVYENLDDLRADLPNLPTGKPRRS
ncbi:haloacid dehalogenase superfamily, subfamily IA, variant 1 with third motif having Dx(3-4)D or Dx(3-4)E [Amycolatopsis sacchari]|uniref:Haloacid dehalogenase superfamily, subfamily IA, variant 1 with third motif having Dx(3-4)D or Dx(3-4)E n=1 Tax=Amycolatopsis sacchari TaxID=115433 RepID=A0A1I3JS67_9PSEU|nr:HAD family hydrolase [Amycolatopsis sacchari]SFI62858.1 haloacid dehalogenase superfamily, subfamily IA, variant 1 with third motif having Dx(3-4)D or Dx(3-4)E [Amycolatopsis sacchari]